MIAFAWAVAALALATQPDSTLTRQDAVAAAEARSRALLAEMEAATLNGWTVRCTEDHFKATKTCRAGTFAEGVPFQIYYIDETGPIMLPGYHDFPGRSATVRVDSGAVHRLGDGNRVEPALMQDLLAGRTAYVVYHVWPDGERRMVVDLTHFSEAMARLDAIR